MSCRRAFTLLELMTASVVMVLVVGGVLSSFIGVRRMTGTAVAEAELSVRMRELREKLLFHAAPPHDGRVWSGILSGADSGAVVESGYKIKMYRTYGYDTVRQRVVDQHIELVPVDAGGLRFLGNDGDRHDERWATRWLDPGGFSWLPSDGWVDGSSLAVGSVFYVGLEASAGGVTRRERVVVPAFGKVQRTLDGKVFDD